ncbi:MAG: sel1 repeat family protein [Desulfovibrio sp.]|nr:sel1 repeat family protein [Desulfovibrio sp.]
MYENGRGVTKDDAKAAKWFRKAAEQGHSDAQYDLGEMYATGGGVTKDDAKAAEWYGKSLSRGIPTFITIWA